MTNEQKKRLIAEKVMGIDIDSRKFERYTPAANADQAIQALEAWLIAGNGARDYESTWVDEDGHMFTLYQEKKNKCDYPMVDVGEATNKDLSAAIVDALCQAVEAK